MNLFHRTVHSAPIVVYFMAALIEGFYGQSVSQRVATANTISPLICLGCIYKASPCREKRSDHQSDESKKLYAHSVSDFKDIFMCDIILLSREATDLRSNGPKCYHWKESLSSIRIEYGELI